MIHLSVYSLSVWFHRQKSQSESSAYVSWLSVSANQNPASPAGHCMFERKTPQSVSSSRRFRPAAHALYVFALLHPLQFFQLSGLKEAVFQTNPQILELLETWTAPEELYGLLDYGSLYGSLCFKTSPQLLHLFRRCCDAVFAILSADDYVIITCTVCVFLQLKSSVKINFKAPP